jgi:acyl-CoA thioester hydrolase
MKGLQANRSGFSVRMKVRFHEVDSMRVVHHSVYLHWLEAARFEFAAAALGLKASAFEELGFHLPVVRAQLEYVASATLDSDVEIYIYCVEREKAMVSFRYEVYDRNTDRLLLKAATDHALVRTDGRLMIRWPDAWMERVRVVREKHPEYFEREN